MEINELQDNDTMEDTLTKANVQQFYGSLNENFNATITFEKNTVTDFQNTTDLQTNVFRYELQKKLKFAPQNKRKLACYGMHFSFTLLSR
jgi:hypothetical protein